MFAVCTTLILSTDDDDDDDPLVLEPGDEVNVWRRLEKLTNRALC